MKEKQEIIRAVAQTEEDRILLASVLDKFWVCQQRQYQTNTKFLDMRQRTLVCQAVRLAGGLEEMVLAGGNPQAERVCAVFFPTYMTAEQALSQENTPICVLRAQKSAADELSHRDYLGALMGMGLQRTAIGDIFVHDKGADFITLQEVKSFVLMEFAKAGRKRLTLSEITEEQIQQQVAQEVEKQGSVSSVRLDSITALVFGVSRSQAQSMIAHGQVYVNFLQITKDEKTVCVGDQITVRGMGRAHILDFTGVSKKGRVFVRFSRSK